MNRCIVIALLAVAVCSLNSLATAATLPSVPGLLFRLDATDVNGDGLADNLANNAVISQWDDISGNNNDAVATAGQEATYVLSGAPNGRPVVHFDGVNDHLQAGGTAPQTIFAVTRVGSQTHNLSGLIGSSGQDKGIRRDVSVPSSAWRGIGGDTNSDDFTFGSNQFYVNGSLSQVAAENTWHVVSAISGAPVTFNNTSIGGYFPGREYLGDYAEVLAYSGALSTTDRQSIESYLQTKWFAAVPEPSTLALLVLGAGGMALAYRRRSR